MTSLHAVPATSSPKLQRPSLLDATRGANGLGTIELDRLSQRDFPRNHLRALAANTLGDRREIACARFGKNLPKSARLDRKSTQLSPVSGQRR